MSAAVIYCRVSTKEQTDNLSLATQEMACRKYCAQNSLEIERVFLESESAKTTRRAEFQKMVEYCRKNKRRVAYVVVYALSRFSRNKRDHHVVRAILKGWGVTVRSATEPTDDTAMGKAMEGMIATFAELDNDIRAERTKAGMMMAVEKGRWPFKAPLGYLNVPDGEANLTPDPDRESLVRRGFELYATGRYSKTEILRKLSALGLRTRSGGKLTAQSLNKMLSNPIYAGWIVINGWGIRHRGRFKPLIEEAVFSQVRRILAGKSPTAVPHQRDHPDFPLRRFVRCKCCGGPLTASWSKGRGGRYGYYRCWDSNCHSVNVRKEQLESIFVDLLRNVCVSPESVALFQEVVRDRLACRNAENDKLQADLQKRLDGLQRKTQRLVEAFVYEKVIDQSTYQEQLDLLKREMADVELARPDVASTSTLNIDKILAFAEECLVKMDQMWEKGTPRVRWQFQKLVFPAGLDFDGNSLGTPEINNVIGTLGKTSAQIDRLASPRGFEPLLQP